MKSRPLIGKKSSPHVSSLFISLIASFCFWSIFIVCSFTIKIQNKRKFETVQIVLSSTPLQENLPEEKKSPEQEKPVPAPETINSEPEPAPEPVAVKEPAPQPEPIKQTPKETPPAPAPKKQVAKETPPAPAPKKTAQQKTSSQKASPTVAPIKNAETPADKKVSFDNFEYAADYSEGYNFSEKSSSQQKDFDWDSFDNSQSSQSNSPTQRKVTSQSEISGTAAAKSESQSTNSSKTKEAAQTQTASAATKNSLQSVKEPKMYSSKLADGSKAVASISTENVGGNLAVEMKDGSKRVLLDPMTPSIKLSSEAAATVVSDISVQISFSVSPDGIVNNINITHESVLTQKVREEIIEQLRRWKFKSAPSSATATFKYSIIKK